MAGQAWVRAPGSDARWLERLRAQPQAQLSRGNGLVRVRGIEDDSKEARTAVNQAMALKYGNVHRVLARLRDPQRAVPVRLVPVTSAAP